MSEHLKTIKACLQLSARSQDEGSHELEVMNLRAAVWGIVRHLEEQAAAREMSASEESPPTTDFPTTVPPWVALDDRIKAEIPLLQRLLGVLTDQELTAVDNSSKLSGLLDRFVSRCKTHALDVPGIISTSPNQGSPSSAADYGHAKLPSSASSDLRNLRGSAPWLSPQDEEPGS